MTPPRQILPNQFFDVTARTLARSFRLVPSPEINGLFTYLLAVLAHKHGIVLYAAVQMSTHYHLVGLDTLGRLPIFMQELNSMFARALNAIQGRDDKVWSGDGYGLVRPATADDLLARIVYALANPAAADLVRRAQDYPGVITRPQEIGCAQPAERPEFFFRDHGRMPKTATLRCSVPTVFAHLGRDGYIDLVSRELAQAEQRHDRERRAAGRTVLGADRCLTVKIGSRSASWERWFTLRPQVAAKVRALRVESIRRLREFRESYRVALSRWRRAMRSAIGLDEDADRPTRDASDVVFPAGTWWMVRFAGVLTE